MSSVFETTPPPSTASTTYFEHPAQRPVLRLAAARAASIVVPLLILGGCATTCLGEAPPWWKRTYTDGSQLACVVWAQAAGTPRTEEQARRNEISEAVRQCVEIHLPNSMARPPGFDLNGHLEELAKQFAAAAVALADHGGFRRIELYIHERKKDEDLEVFCALDLLAANPSREATRLLKTLTKHENELVRSEAEKLLLGRGKGR